MESLNAKVLVDIPYVNIFRLRNNERVKIIEENLKIGCLADQNIYFLNVGTFNYTLE